MCGIAGFQGNTSVSDLRAIAKRMADTMVHRGPDDGGVWVDEAASLALSHRRLSIVDLSAAGHQPMLSSDGRYVIAFNGEIYNHQNLRHALDAHVASSGTQGDRRQPGAWHGHSDTETLLECISVWGVQETLKKCIGMFAFALWDRSKNLLTLARDRLGEKPLYYGWHGDAFLFGSELKALRAHPAFRAELNRDALSLYMRHNCVPSPYSIYRDTYKLPPGAWMVVEPGRRNCVPQYYWTARQAAEYGQNNIFGGTDDEAREALDRVLRESISGQMLADVPLGAFLSGGIDSSTVVALMQELSERPAKTFTIGFHEDGYNEAQHAHSVARYLGTEHTEHYLSAQQAISVIPGLAPLFDEPFADSSQIPTFLLSELTRRHVTVSLSGDGGDELFGGYNRYFWVTGIWRRFGWLPQSMRSALAGLLVALPPSTWNVIISGMARFLPAGWRYANPGDKLHKLSEILAVRTADEIYHGLVSHWKRPTDVVLGSKEPVTALTDPARMPALRDLENRMMYLDLITYLPDDILTKVDRSSMGVSLEARVPFLDHRVVEFAWTLPLGMKIRDGNGKWLLRQVLYQYLPKDLVERPKMGFGIPLDVWLRGPLQKWAESLIEESKLKSDGVFDASIIRRKWAEHLSGKRNWSYYLWDVLMFQAWKERWL